MERLTVQAFIDNAWQDIAEIGFPESEQDNYLPTRQALPERPNGRSRLK
ncbi:hypothetical protein [Dickeya dianthicola]